MKKLLFSIILVLSLALSPLGWAGSSDPVIEGKSATDINIDGGAIDSTPIGSGTPQTGAFTTLGTTSDVTVGSGGDPADAGAIRLKNADKIVWEASPAGADIEGIAVDANEIVQIGAAGASGVTITPAVTLVGGQIAFPAAAVPSADPNTMDDYEEGDSETTITCTTSGSYTLDAAINTFVYTKIGRNVHLQGQLTITGEASPVGNLLITLPFVSATLTEKADYLVGSAVLSDHGGSIPNGVCSYIAGDGATTFRLVNIADNGIFSYIGAGDVDTAFVIFVGFNYTM